MRAQAETCHCRTPPEGSAWPWVGGVKHAQVHFIVSGRGPPDGEGSREVVEAEVMTNRVLPLMQVQQTFGWLPSASVHRAVGSIPLFLTACSNQRPRLLAMRASVSFFSILCSEAMCHDSSCLCAASLSRPYACHCSSLPILLRPDLTRTRGLAGSAWRRNGLAATSNDGKQLIGPHRSHSETISRSGCSCGPAIESTDVTFLSPTCRCWSQVAAKEADTRCHNKHTGAYCDAILQQHESWALSCL